MVPKLNHLNIAINETSQDKETKQRQSVERSATHKRQSILHKTNTTVVRRMESKLKDILDRHIQGTLHSVKEYSWYDPVGINAPLDFQDQTMGNAPSWYGNESGALESQASAEKTQVRQPHQKRHSRNSSRSGTSLRKHQISKFGTKKSGFGIDLQLNNGGGSKSGTLNGGATSSKMADTMEEKEELNDTAKEIQGSRILVLMLGGATFAETKDAYSVMKRTGREVIMCTTGMLTPVMFTESLKNMARTEEKDEDEGDA